MLALGEEWASAWAGARVYQRLPLCVPFRVPSVVLELVRATVPTSTSATHAHQVMERPQFPLGFCEPVRHLATVSPPPPLTDPVFAF